MSEAASTPKLITSELASYEGPTDLTFSGVMTHKVDSKTGQEYLLLAEGISYPQPGAEDMLDDLVLPLDTDSNGQQYLSLPPFYRTLDQVVREASINDDLFVEGAAIFTQIGDELSNLAKSDNQVLTDIQARHLLVVTDGDWSGLKILPPQRVSPLELVDYTVKDLRTMLRLQFYNSIYYRITDKREEEVLPQLFKHFVEAFELDDEEVEPDHQQTTPESTAV